MSLSTSKLAYEDCYELYDAALEDPTGARYRVDGRNAGTHLVMRMHMARTIIRDENARVYDDPDHPQHGRSPYDGLTVTLRKVADQHYVYVRRNRLNGEIERLDDVAEPAGTLLAPDPPTKKIEAPPTLRLPPPPPMKRRA